MSAVITAKPRSSVTSDRCAIVRPAATPPAADATSSSIPRRRLIRLRPVVAADTALDVAMTVTRLIAAAVLKSTP